MNPNKINGQCLCLIILAWSVCACCFGQTNTNQTTELPDGFRTWTFKQGGKFAGKIVGFSGADTVVLKGLDGTNRNAGIPLFIISDQQLINSIKSTKLLDREGVELGQKGYIEITESVLFNFPERVQRKKVWMDCMFKELRGGDQLTLKFSVKDKTGETVSSCESSKETSGEFVKTDDAVSALHKGDHVRLTGMIWYPVKTDGALDPYLAHFVIDSVKITSPAEPKGD